MMQYTERKMALAGAGVLFIGISAVTIGAVLNDLIFTNHLVLGGTIMFTIGAVLVGPGAIALARKAPFQDGAISDKHFSANQKVALAATGLVAAGAVAGSIAYALQDMCLQLISNRGYTFVESLAVGSLAMFILLGILSTGTVLGNLSADPKPGDMSKSKACGYCMAGSAVVVLGTLPGILLTTAVSLAPEISIATQVLLAASVVVLAASAVMGVATQSAA